VKKCRVDCILIAAGEKRLDNEIHFEWILVPGPRGQGEWMRVKTWRQRMAALGIQEVEFFSTGYGTGASDHPGPMVAADPGLRDAGDSVKLRGV
jgi:hypothetical protein